MASLLAGRDEGRFHFAAPPDDMIASAGCNMAGPKIETALLLHLKVARLHHRRAPDAERGMIVEAHVILAEDVTDDELMAKLLQDNVK